MKANIVSRCFYFTLPLTCALLSPTSVRADSVDVFPLHLGLEYRYQYTGQFYSWNYSLHSGGTDSGLVVCKVTDSLVLNDTTIQWTITETRHLLSTRSWTPPYRDTTFLTDDSTTVSLFEVTTGHHPLFSQSLAWNSPRWTSYSDTVPLYRHADSSPTFSTIAGGWCMIVPANFDSVWQSIDSGMFRRSWSRCFDYDEIGDYERHTFRLESMMVVRVNREPPLPTQVCLFQNFPNPFNSTTAITYELPGTADVQMTVHDVLGRQVAVLCNDSEPPGRHIQHFDGSRLSTGMYFVRLQVAGLTNSIKVVLLR